MQRKSPLSYPDPDNRILKAVRVVGIFLTLVLLVLLQRSFTPVSASDGLESRISRLEAENFQLRAQLSRIESQVSRLTGLESRPPTRVNPLPPPRTQNPPRPSQSRSLGDDPMFKRLATLVIELRERIVALETKLKQL
jgi:hypothetical protein